MKPILCAGAVLMIGASIYGFADYKKTVRTQAFKNMYQENEKKQPVVDKKDEPIKTFTETKDLVLEEGVVEEKAVVKKTSTENSPGVPTKGNKIRKQKKLDAELFSRAPLKKYQEIKETPESLEKVEKRKSVQ